MSSENQAETENRKIAATGSATTPVTPVLQQEAPKPAPRAGVPVPMIILFLIISFLGGLTIAIGYFQTQLQKLNTVKTETQVTAPKPQILVIGTDTTGAPMEFMNKQGDIIGYDVDMGYRLANEMGVKVQFKSIPWDDIFTSLEQKKIDMIISSVTITDERKQKFLFSDPYINAGQVIVSRKENPITSTDLLKGKKISVQKGTTNEKEALKYTDPTLVMSFEDFDVANKAVADGKADATISDLTLAKGFLSKFDNLKITSEPFTTEYYGIVLRKDQEELRTQVNAALEVLRVKGTLSDLKQKWLE